MRQVSIVIAVLVLVGGAAGFVYFKNKRKGQDKSEQKPVKYVNSLVVKNRSVASTIPVTGRLTAREKIAVIAEVGGKVLNTNKEFREGVYFNKGETMIAIDDSEFRLNLLAQKSSFLNLLTQILPDIKIDHPESLEQWEAYLEKYDVNKSIPELPEPKDSKEKFYLASRNIFTQYYNIKSQEERLDKFTIRAPFNGTVTASMVNEGATIPAGRQLGEFINPNTFELEAAVSAVDIDFVEIGDTVQLTSRKTRQSWNGQIIRISDRIDPATQSIKIFVAVKGEKLKEGLYLDGEIRAGQIDNAIEVPRKLVLENDQLYTIQDTILEKKAVNIVKINKQTAIIRGLEDGSVIMNERMPGAYDGMVVKPREPKSSEAEEQAAD